MIRRHYAASAAVIAAAMMIARQAFDISCQLRFTPRRRCRHYFIDIFAAAAITLARHAEATPLSRIIARCLSQRRCRQRQLPR